MGKGGVEKPMRIKFQVGFDKIKKNIFQIANSLNDTVKGLRIEAGNKKFTTMSIRPQTLAILSHPAQCKSTRENFRLKNTSKFISGVKSSWSKAI